MEKKPSPRIAVTAALVVAVGWSLSTGSAAAQSSAREILETATERYEARMGGIENYTLVQAVDGAVSTLYHERVESEGGRPLFRPVSPDELTEGVDGDAVAEAADLYAVFHQMAPRAVLRGEESVDGREAYVITVNDLSGIDFGSLTGLDEGSGSFVPSSVTVWLDTERYVALRTSMAGMVEMDGRDNEVTFDIRMEDYREVDGMLHPFRTEIAIEGFGAALSDEQRQQMERARERMQRQLERMSDEQRAMAEQMMDERMPDMASMSGESMTATVEVRELEVNAGPPENVGMQGRQEARSRAERQRRAAGEDEGRQEAREPVERPSPVDTSEYEPQYARYHGVYQSSGREGRSFFVTETCDGGRLAMGAMWGDVAPWVFEEVSEGEFRAPPISPGGSGMRVRIETDGGGAQVLTILSDGWEEYGTLTLSEELPERWDDCMQRRR